VATEQTSNTILEFGSNTMAKEIKSALIRSSDTIISDALGVAALCVMLFVGLSLPAMV